jgi:Ca-activated chloride channel family protein
MALGDEKQTEESGASGAADVETVLTQAAGITGGKYFHATDSAALEEIYAEIDGLARVPSTNLSRRQVFTSIAPWLLSGSLALLLGGMTLRASRWGVIP